MARNVHAVGAVRAARLVRPLFWSGKPAIRASSSIPAKAGRPVTEDALYVGYYVERGRLVDDDPNKVMDQSWHWHGFYRCLSVLSPEKN